jgi:hypothetical protein
MILRIQNIFILLLEARPIARPTGYSPYEYIMKTAGFVIGQKHVSMGRKNFDMEHAT